MSTLLKIHLNGISKNCDYNVKYITFILLITITHRNYDRIDQDEFKKDLTAKLKTINNSDNLQELYNEYMQAIKPTLEIHAPEVSKIVTKRRLNPWFDHAAHQLKSKRRVEGKNASETKLNETKKNTNKSIRHTRPTFKITKRNT